LINACKCKATYYKFVPVLGNSITNNVTILLRIKAAFHLGATEFF